jgi:dihydrofolate synthase/folylpolyglutamate synthase
MNYLQSKEWLKSLKIAMKDFNLETIKSLCKIAKINPEKFRTIHVAGSNGKGSTCQFISTILVQAGYKTGFYSSPHLIEPTERIKINGKDISKKEFSKLAGKVKKIIDTNKIKANYFEAITLMAFIYFEKQKIDYLVAEVGMGGRLDATNVLKGIVCAITSISLEHTQYLGNTIEKIAFEKAGIIKKESIVVVGKNNAGLKTILQTAKKNNCKVFAVEWKKIKSNLNGNEFNLEKPVQLNGLKTKLIGAYQIENAAIATACAIALREKGAKIPIKAIRTGLKKTFWPGRIQIVMKNPRVVVDASHNPDGWKKLFEVIKMFKFKKLIMVFGVLNDKDIKSSISKIKKADVLILTKPDSDRAKDPFELRKEIGFGLVEPNPKKAILSALQKTDKKSLLLITGSIYLIGYAEKFFQKTPALSKNLSKQSH